MSDEHYSVTVGCGCWTVCSCGFEPEWLRENSELTPVMWRAAVDAHITQFISPTN